MLSSAKRVRRSMGDTHRIRIDAHADAVDAAEAFGEARSGGVQVHHVDGVGLEACAEVGPVLDRGEDFELDVADIPAQRAPGLAAERVVKPRLGDGEHLHDTFIGARADLLSKHGAATVGDHHDHQRPENQHDADQCRQVAQEPQGNASTLHAADYTLPFTPADPVPLFPPNCSGKWLMRLEFVAVFPPNRDNDFPPNSAPFPSLQAAPSGPSGHLPRTSCEGGLPRVAREA